MDFFGWMKENPESVAFIVILLLGIIILFRFKRIKFTTKMVVIMGVAIALSVVLNMVVLYQMPQGGSVTLASMAPIFFVALVYGPEAGFFSGLVFGILNMILGGYIVHWAQMLLDYPLAFMFLGSIGYFRSSMNVGAVVATLLRFLSHVVSGAIFFKDGAGEMNPWLFSGIYNGTFLLPDLIIVLIVLNLLPLNRIAKVMNSEATEIKR